MKDFSKRATRGTRMRKLVKAEEEADDDFWAQDFFAESSEDYSFSVDPDESSDKVDSDFDDQVSSAGSTDEEAETRRAERASKAKKAAGPYKDAAIKRARDAAAVVSGKEKKPKAKRVKTEPAVVLPADRSLRAGTKQRSAARAQRDVEEKARRAARPKRVKAEERVWTQEELLERAKVIEEENIASLHAFLAQQEELKRKQRAQRAASKPRGPRVIFHSRAGAHSVTFLPEYPRVLLAGEMVPAPPGPTNCAITGTPAKYKDPLTQKGYSSIQAFKTLRSQVNAK